MSNINYLSSGELAELAGISRQIIRHYEQKDILSPTYIDHNGYRYYKPETYFTLEIIISMRKLDIPLNSIKEFLENRNIEILETFYSNYLDKLENVQRQIDMYQKHFKRRLQLLEEYKNIPLNTVMIVPTFDFDVIGSTEIPINASSKERFIALANFLRPVLKQKEHKDYLIGYLAHFDDLLNPKNDAHFHAIIYPNQPLDEIMGKKSHIKGGLCLSVVFKDDYGRIPLETIHLIQEYIEHNNLKISDKVFVCAVGDHWCSKSWDNVLCRLYIKIA